MAVSFLCFSAFAHEVHLFVTTEGDVLRGRLLYNDHDPAVGAAVTLSDDLGRERTSTETDSDGRFGVVLPAAGEYRIAAETVDGHRADEIVAVTKEAFDAHTGSVGADSPRMEELMERMDHLEHRTGLRDVLGGIGYVLGFLALFVLLKKRRNG
jgi:nickel transport protein